MSAQELPAVIVKAKAYAAFVSGLLGTLTGALAAFTDTPAWVLVVLGIATPVSGYIATYQAPYVKVDPEASVPVPDGAQD